MYQYRVCLSVHIIIIDVTHRDKVVLYWSLGLVNIQFVPNAIIDPNFITIAKVSQLLLLRDFVEMPLSRFPRGHLKYHGLF